MRMVAVIFCLYLAGSGSLFFAERGNAQEIRPTRAELSELVPAPIDTSRLLSDVPLKSPTGAVLRSAVLPGWGQMYNEQYWKAGLAFSANATLGYFIFHYNRLYRTTGNKDYQNKRNQYTWYLALGYALTMLDAYVDAYLYKFDLAMSLADASNGRERRWVPMLELSFRF